jgi:hypothetical protein
VAHPAGAFIPSDHHGQVDAKGEFWAVCRGWGPVLPERSLTSSIRRKL